MTRERSSAVRKNKSTWIVLGAVTGLVIAFSTRWYWGAGAFVLLALATAAAHLSFGLRRVR